MSRTAMEQLYAELILDHARTPEGRTLEDAPEPQGPCGESHQVNPTCGDEIRLRVELDPAGRVAHVRWAGQGCSISQASASVLTGLVEGAEPAAAEQLGEDFRSLLRGRGAEAEPGLAERLGDLTAFTGVARFPARVKCALLAWAALREALALAVTKEER
jgi:SUF system FeS assembly protein, NifU family